MSTSPLMSFREFLEAKADEFGVRDRHRLRKEWIASLNQLMDQLQEWLQQADPEGLLDIVRYKVARTERGLGTYDAPAMTIRLGAGEVDIVPISVSTHVSVLGPEAGRRHLYAARVGITDGHRKYNLVRSLSNDDGWLIQDFRQPFTKLTSESLQQVLQDLLS